MLVAKATCENLIFETNDYQRLENYIVKKKL